MAPGRIAKNTDAEKYDDPIAADGKDDEDYVVVDSDDDDEDEFRDDDYGNEHSKLSKGERKTLKAMLKLGMKPVSDVVSRVAIKRSKNEFFIMSKPDVYKSTNSNRYVIIGEGREAKFEYSDSQLQNKVAHLVKLAGMVPDMNTPKIISGASPQKDKDEEVDETGIEPRDLKLVMLQTGASRNKALRALKRHEGDFVSAIMDLIT